MKPRQRIAPISKKRAAAHPELVRSGRTVKAGGKPKAVNAKRKNSEFARCYHSKERVAFVKSLHCLCCSPNSIALGPVDNAHTEGGGAGRKADYTTIVPLCRTHHMRFDRYEEPFHIEEVRDGIRSRAAKVEKLWQSHRSALEGRQ